MMAKNDWMMQEIKYLAEKLFWIKNSFSKIEIIAQFVSDSFIVWKLGSRNLTLINSLA